MSNEVKARHSHGRTERFTDLNAAMASLREIYGDEIVTEGNVEEGRILVWQDEAAAVDDSGARAVATIALVHQD